MKAYKANTSPQKIENLGDYTFHYNFNIIERESEEGTLLFEYDQVRCKYPIDVNKIQHLVDSENYNHTVEL